MNLGVIEGKKSSLVVCHTEGYNKSHMSRPITFKAPRLLAQTFRILLQFFVIRPWDSLIIVQNSKLRLRKIGVH